jgi:hypothetical protein
LNETGVYKVALPTYTATGGDGFTMIRDNLITHHIPGKEQAILLVSMYICICTG